MGKKDIGKSIGAIFFYFVVLNLLTLGVVVYLGGASSLSKTICSNGILLWAMAILPCVSNGLRWWLGLLLGAFLTIVWSATFGYVVSQMFGNSIDLSAVPSNIALASAYVAFAALAAWMLTKTFVFSSFNVLRAGG